MLLSTYEMTSDGKLLVKTAYANAIVEKCREWGGRFDKDAGGWYLAATRLPEIVERIGDNLADTVEVEVGMDDVEGHQQIRVGWHVLASRATRDRPCNLFADLIAGTIPKSGGSVKHPAVDASEDARFRLVVPRSFATARGLKLVSEQQPNYGASLLEHLQRWANAHDLSLSLAVRVLCGEVNQQATAGGNNEIELCAIGLFGAFYKPEMHGHGLAKGYARVLEEIRRLKLKRK